MLLSLLELILTLGCILEQDRLHATAANIMLGKPFRLRNTFYRNETFANSKSTVFSGSQLQPFWQGDLQGLYSVHNITITQIQSPLIIEALIGVSSVDFDCQNDDVTWCGQWPLLTGSTMTFKCWHEQPVRFVRVWRNIKECCLALKEVEVEGTPKRQNARMYDKSLNTKLNQTVTSVNAVSATDCGIKCLGNQPCLAFSYNPAVQPPCVFATSTATTTASSWVTFSVSACYNHHF